MTPARNSTPMAAKIAQPWRSLPTMRPNTLVSAAPMAKIEIICTKFESAVGFSNGWAALALKKPPPLVPSILMAIWEATGPTAMVCLAHVPAERSHQRDDDSAIESNLDPA